MPTVVRGRAAKAAVDATTSIDDNTKKEVFTSALLKKTFVPAKGKTMAERMSSFVKYDHLEKPRNFYDYIAAQVKYKLVDTSAFEAFIQVAILLVAMTTGIPMMQRNWVEDGMPRSKAVVLETLNEITAMIFTAEVILKLVAEGTRPLQYWLGENAAWNNFDFIIVGTSWVMRVASIEGGSMTSTLRLLRILRLIKFVKGIPKLYVIMIGLIAGLKSVVYIIVLLVLVLYLFAVAGCMLFGENDPVHFETTAISIATLFRCATLAAWPQPFFVNYYGCDRFVADIYSVDTDDSVKLDHFSTIMGRFPEFQCTSPKAQPVVATVFFFMYVILTAFVILSLFIGVITMGMFQAMEAVEKGDEDDDESAHDHTHSDGTEEGQETETHEEALIRRERDIRAFLDDNFIHNALVDLEDDMPLSKLAHDRPMVAQYERLSKSMYRLSVHPDFNNFITLVILVAGISVGMDTDGTVVHKRATLNFLIYLDYVVLGIFTVEVAVKLIAEGLTPVRYFDDSWNSFDFIIVLLGYMDFVITVDGVQMLRLLRLLRVFKLAKSFPKLRSIVEATLQGFQSVIWAVLLMLVSNYIFGILGVMLFSSNDRMYFGDLVTAMISTFMVVTLDHWEEMMLVNVYGCQKFGYFELGERKTTAYGCHTYGKDDDMDNSGGLGWIAVVYFVILVIYGGLVIPTVLIGVVSVSFNKSTERIEVERKEEEQIKAILKYAKPQYPNFLTHKRCANLASAFKSLVEHGLHPYLDETKIPVLDFPTAKLYFQHVAPIYFNVFAGQGEKLTKILERILVMKLEALDDKDNDHEEIQYITFPQFIWVHFVLCVGHDSLDKLQGLLTDFHGKVRSELIQRRLSSSNMDNDDEEGGIELGRLSPVNGVSSKKPNSSKGHGKPKAPKGHSKNAGTLSPVTHLVDSNDINELTKQYKKVVDDNKLLKKRIEQLEKKSLENSFSSGRHGYSAGYGSSPRGSPRSSPRGSPRGSPRSRDVKTNRTTELRMTYRDQQTKNDDDREDSQGTDLDIVHGDSVWMKSIADVEMAVEQAEEGTTSRPDSRQSFHNL